MKKIFFLSIISFSLLFSSCDYVANPYPERNANIGDTASCPAPTFPLVTSHIKKILIEDYTGHTCPNCPRAARAISHIDSTYPGKFIALGIACSSLAAPSPNFGGSGASAFLSDYRTPVGTTYDNFFGASHLGLPEGMFNRKDYDATALTHLKFYTGFQAYAASIVNEPSVVDLQLAIDYDITSRKVCCSVRDSFLTTVSGNYKLVVLISQDSIVDWQDDIDQTPATIPNYLHHHLLRDAITPTGAWGEALANNTSASIHHFAYTIPGAYNSITCVPKNCHIVAYIYNTATYEIIQSEEAKVIP